VPNGGKEDSKGRRTQKPGSFVPTNRKKCSGGPCPQNHKGLSQSDEWKTNHRGERSTEHWGSTWMKGRPKGQRGGGCVPPKESWTTKGNQNVYFERNQTVRDTRFTYILRKDAKGEKLPQGRKNAPVRGGSKTVQLWGKGKCYSETKGNGGDLPSPEGKKPR